MEFQEFWPFEEELGVEPPRPVALTSAGKRDVFLVFGAVLGTVGAAAWSFLAKAPAEQPGGLVVAFLAFAVLGIYLISRLTTVWRTRRRLVCGGSPAEGVVVERRSEMLGMSRYRVWYQASGAEWQVEALGPARAAGIGDVLTVLYDPDRPDIAVVYAFSGCAATLPVEQLSPGDMSHSALQPKI